MSKKLISLILLAALTMSACAQATQSTPTSPAPVESAPATQPEQSAAQTLTIMTHDSFAMSDSVRQKFEEQYNIKLQFLPSGDTGTALNKAILAKDKPLADVFYGVDNTFLSRALNEGIFETYNSPVLADIPDQFKLDPQNRALPVDYGDVCLNYDIAYLAQKGIAPPQNLEDLLKPEYKSTLVVENPATSSPGLAFLLTTVGAFGESGYLDYWKGLLQNDVKVVNDWNSAYYTEFSRSGGTRPIVVSYNSSPVFEVIGSKEPSQEPPTAAVVSDNSCFRQIEFVGILQGTQKRALAEKWVDFMLSPTFQEDMPLQMYVFPVNSKAVLNDTFKKYLQIPQKTASVSPDEIAAKRDQWIQAWTDTVLR